MEDLALAFVSTIRHDGHGGVADDLIDLASTRTWLEAQGTLLVTFGVSNINPTQVTAEVHHGLLDLRKAVRALFAHAVRPGAPSRADASHLLPIAEALRTVNEAAANQPVWQRLELNAEGQLQERTQLNTSSLETDLNGAVARATIALLTGPHGQSIRACQAPRCVRYFIKTHPRQECCKPSCANRARVARHYYRHQAKDESGT